VRTGTWVQPMDLDEVRLLISVSEDDLRPQRQRRSDDDSSKSQDNEPPRHLHCCFMHLRTFALYLLISVFPHIPGFTMAVA
jgi:hypothetical protein